MESDQFIERFCEVFLHEETACRTGADATGAPRAVCKCERCRECCFHYCDAGSANGCFPIPGSSGEPCPVPDAD